MYLELANGIYTHGNQNIPAAAYDVIDYIQKQLQIAVQDRYVSGCHCEWIENGDIDLLWRGMRFTLFISLRKDKEPMYYLSNVQGRYKQGKLKEITAGKLELWHEIQNMMHLFD